MKYDHVIRTLEADLAEYRNDLKRSELHRPEWVKDYARIVSEIESAIALLRREQERTRLEPNLETEEDRAFWEAAEQASNRVKDWPDWKKENPV